MIMFGTWGFASGRFRWPSWRLALAWLTLAVLEISPTLGNVRNLDCPPAFFNFGDSFTATGSGANAFPFTREYENPPYGVAFFRRPAKRVTDGRVVPDFFSLAFGITLLQPYIQAGPFDFRYGVNFAFPESTASNDSSRSQYFLPIQIAQFVRFKQHADRRFDLACSAFQRFLPKSDAYAKALFTIEIGGNDINFAVQRGLTAAQIRAQIIPAAIANVENAIKTLHRYGARNFLLFNINPAGCSAVILTTVGGPLDSDDCNALVNQLDRDYNAALLALVRRLRTQFRLARIAIFDFYNANLEILRNPERYGFDPASTKTACCGAPGVGAFNYNPAVICGRGATKCANPERYINWDGIRQTEAFYRVIATFALNGRYTDLSIDYASQCRLDFSNFGSSATYDQVYPNECDTTFSGTF